MLSSEKRSKSDDKLQMTKAAGGGPFSSSPATLDNSVKNDQKKKKSIIPIFFGSKRNSRESSEEEIGQSADENDDRDSQNEITSRRKAFPEPSEPTMPKSFSERHKSPKLNLSDIEQSMAPVNVVRDIRVFVATWNVGGKTPDYGLNLEDFLQVEDSADIYVLGFQEIVPLSAGNVLVIEDNEPAARWLTLINHALNNPGQESVTSSDSSPHSKHSDIPNDSKSNFFQKPSLKVLSRNFRADSGLLKACNGEFESSSMLNRRPRTLSDPSGYHHDSSVYNMFSIGENSSHAQLDYLLIASKQMVGIFLTVWARKELVRHIGHLKIDCIGRGIMGCLRNKGCIAVRLTLYQTSFCFVCSHLASGEKEGDELRRNADVAEILKNIHFPKFCKHSYRKIPERIIDHDRIIWLGDLNYRVSLSYEETRLLLEDNDWDALLEKDQLNMEREAGRVFSRWNEGKILFAPTYKYSHNSDSYAGETTKSKKKRRTPAWCDRILWHGNGIEQLCYIRGESRFSDHRPVCAVFEVAVEMNNNRKNTRLRKGFSCTATTFNFDNCMPRRHSFVDV